MDDELQDLFSNFPSLNEDEVKAISESIVVGSFEKGTILLREGQVSKECYSVLKGCVRQYYIVDGEEKTTAFFIEGEAVASYSSYVNQVPSKHYLVCVEDCSLTIGTKGKDIEMCLRFPKLEQIIRSEMEKNAGKAQEEHSFFITSSPEERYLNLIKNRPKLLNRVPQHQIASFLGIKPESLSRLRKRIISK